MLQPVKGKGRAAKGPAGKPATAKPAAQEPAAARLAAQGPAGKPAVQGPAGKPAAAAQDAGRPAARRQRRALILAALLVFVAAPVTLALGTLFDTGNSYATSVLVIIYALVPFFAAFEHSRPKAHDVVIVAVMCALAVVARAAFFWLPYFTPVTGVIIIAAIALGAVPGFMVGAITLFVSNFLFAQGPWTPWQMSAYGLTGFVFGLLAQRGKIPPANLTLKGKVGLAVGGFAFVACITGPLLDTSSVFMMLSQVTPEGALAVYASGLPVNLIHASATALTLFLLANPLLGQLDRIRTKYGLME